MKRIMYALLMIIGLVLFLVLVGFIFIKTSPQFGQTPVGEDQKALEKSSHYKSGIFVNDVSTNMDMPVGKLISVMYQFLFNTSVREPKGELPQVDFTTADLTQSKPEGMHLRWFGHSAFYLNMEGKHILLDPMLGPSASPIQFMTKRFNDDLPIEISELPQIDAVLYSHDHYDHLDYHSVMKLKDKVGHWFVALGIGSHLKSWGIEAEKITELDWWEEADFEGLKIVATPARHFSGRGVTDRFKTFWNSYVIQGSDQSLFFSGDGGYWDGFKQIGEKYGPFDMCLIECGAYNEAWKDIHMMPEESAQACVDLKGKRMIPIHWGAFNLALHDWTDPIERVSAKAKELNVDLVTPIIGEKIVVPLSLPNSKWWDRLD